jgi:hypothetical protein
MNLKIELMKGEAFKEAKDHSISIALESVEKIIRTHHARILAVETDFTILEKTGFEETISVTPPSSLLSKSIS